MRLKFSLGEGNVTLNIYNYILKTQEYGTA